MSKKTREKKEAREQDPLAQRARLAGLSALVLLQWCCIVGSRGPWWQPLYRGEAFGDPTIGAGDPWGGLIILAALAGFFFTSYDLVAGEDIHLPVLLTSLVVAVGAGQVFHRVYWSESTIESVAEEVGHARALGLIDREVPLVPPGAPPDAAPVGSTAPGDQDRTVVVGAPVVLEGGDAVPTEDDVLLSGGLSLRFCWGLALILTATPLMIIVSAAMTLLARRAPESVP